MRLQIKISYVPPLRTTCMLYVLSVNIQQTPLSGAALLHLQVSVLVGNMSLYILKKRLPMLFHNVHKFSQDTLLFINSCYTPMYNYGHFHTNSGFIPGRGVGNSNSVVRPRLLRLLLLRRQDTSSTGLRHETPGSGKDIRSPKSRLATIGVGLGFSLKG